MTTKTITSVQKGWIDYMKAHKEKREMPYSPLMEIRGYRDKMFYYSHGIYHVRANDGTNKYNIKLLGVIDNRFSIVAAICFEGCEEVEMFDNDGDSRSGKYKLEIEYTHFDQGDYVKTDTGAIGILANNDWLQCGIWETGTEFVKSNCNGIPVELCSEAEKKQIDELLFVNNMRFNEETKLIEKI